MLINGEHTCEKCNTVNEWVYLVPQKLTERNLVADTIPNGKVRLGRHRRISDTEYELCYRCPKCDKLNIFPYTSDRYL